MLLILLFTFYWISIHSFIIFSEIIIMLQKYLPYIVSIILLIIWIYFSYFHYGNQSFDRSYVMLYVLLLVVFFGGYKFFQSLTDTKSYHVSPLLLGGIFFLHLLVLCMLFAGISGENFLLGITFWFFLSFQLLCILLFWIIIYLTGKTTVQFLDLLPKWSPKSSHIFASLSLGFLLVVMLLFSLLSAGMYNIYTFFWVFWILCIISYPQVKSMCNTLFKPLIIQDLRSDRWYIKAFLDELHYIILTLFISVNFISAYRPYPIGWDDLGAYMNYPKLFSGAWELLALGNMYAWEIYTGIGFLFGSQTTAFLLNSFSGVLVCLVLFLAFSSFKKWESLNTFSFPLLGVLILMMLPMTVFQLAKDMKLDYGLLFVSMSAIFLLLSALWQSSQEKIQYNWKFWLFIGVLAWFAFSIKITSLLLILSLIALIAYKKGWIFLYFSLVFVIIALFSITGLWSMLNVIFPSDIQTRLYYGFISLSLWVFFWVLSLKKYSFHSLVDVSRITVLLLLWCVVALLPWFTKHISETTLAWESLSITRLISWVGERYQPDYSLLYSESEISERNPINGRWLSATGTTTNEDFWRYFWYEEGINNYLKLPWNLTFQVNQGGEFTNITYLFFILLPVFLFVFVYKKSFIPFVFIGLWVILLLYFIPSPLSTLFTSFFSFFTLPYGYIWVFIWYFLIFVLFELFIEKQKNTYADIFLALLAFWSFYVFLWAISSFGIVWYGIVMYAVFLGLIVVWLYQSEENNLGYMPYVVLIWVWIYIIFSGIAHATDNLKKAWYLDYKLGQVSEYEALFRYHPDYFPFLFAFNLSETGKLEVLSQAKQWLIEAFSQVPEYKDILEVIAQVRDDSELERLIRQLDTISLPSSVQNSFEWVKEGLYRSLIAPSDDIWSSDIVYRLWTFMKYYITENNVRVWDDNLIHAFDTYIFDEDNREVTERLQTLWISYLLFDLNSATIDQDPRQDLTRRYENLLRYSLSEDVVFEAGDSVCYRLARDLYQLWEIPLENAVLIAWVNYGSSEAKRKKMTDCILTLYESIQQNIVETNPTFHYLLPYQRLLVQFMEEKWVANEVQAGEILSFLVPYIHPGFKVLIRIPKQ